MGREKAFDELNALSRLRPLTTREAHCLALAIKRGQAKGQKPWTSGDLDRLKRYLGRGKKPAMIAILMARTERAVWRKIYKEGLAVGKLCPRHVYTPSRLRRREPEDYAPKRRLSPEAMAEIERRRTIRSETMNTQQAASVLGVDLAYLSKIHAEGEGPPCVLIGRVARYYLADLESFPLAAVMRERRRRYNVGLRKQRYAVRKLLDEIDPSRVQSQDDE